MSEISEISASGSVSDIESDPPAPPASPPAAPNIDLQTFRAEAAFLAETDSETLLKGLLLECRELVRGTANAICNPRLADLHDDYARQFKIAVQLGVDLSGAIAHLRSGGTEERRQRIIVERVEKRSLPPHSPAAPLAPLGVEGGAPICENE